MERKLREKTKQKNQYCDRCNHYGNPKSIMFTKKLDYQETRKKLTDAKIDSIAIAVYLGYNYWECPICHYYKFVVK